MSEEFRFELTALVDALRSRIAWDRETGRPLPFVRRSAKGDTNMSIPEKVCRPLEKSRLADSLTANAISLEDVRMQLGDCRRCPLGIRRTNLVFGEGNYQADLVFVGEAPGADEDREGRPFVGRAGQLLTKIIDAMGLTRQDVYICNILKCRPPGNRNPEPREIEACEPFLVKQLQAISPRAICALGTFAAKTLLKKEVPITALRGRFHTYEGIKVMPTFHPAYLLRNPSAKKQVWEDVQIIMKELSLGKR